MKIIPETCFTITRSIPLLVDY